MSIETIHICDNGNCRIESDQCLCNNCLENKLAEEYDRGFEAGKLEGFDDGRSFESEY